MKILNITYEQCDEIKALAKFLGRSEHLIWCEWKGHDAAQLVRKKATDRQYNIINTDNGLLVVMDYEDLNYYPKPLVGHWYYMRLSNAKVGELATVYLIEVLESTDDYIKVNYHTHITGVVRNVTFSYDQVSIVSFEKTTDRF